MLLTAVAVLVGCAPGCAQLPAGSNWSSKPSASPKSEPSKAAAAGLETPSQKIKRLKQFAKSADKLPALEQDQHGAALAKEFDLEEDILVRAQILRTIARIPTSHADETLTKGLVSEQDEIRIAACEALGDRGGAEAVRQLAEVLANDPQTDVRLAAARALGESDDEAAMPALAKALEDEDPAMQHRAVLSLRRVTGKDFGDDVNAWRAYVQGEQPPAPSLADRIRRWF